MLAAGVDHCTVKKERLLRAHNISESEKKIKNESRSECESSKLRVVCCKQGVTFSSRKVRQI